MEVGDGIDPETRDVLVAAHGDGTLWICAIPEAMDSTGRLQSGLVCSLSEVWCLCESALAVALPALQFTEYLWRCTYSCSQWHSWWC